MMNLWQRLLTKLKIKKPQPAISRQEAMQVMPVRNPSLDWETNEEGNVVVTLPRRRDWKGRLLTFFFPIPEARPVVLDEVGSFVWQRCDGSYTMAELIRCLCEEYNLNRKEVQVSLIEYMKMLGRRGMIAIAVPEEIMAELDKATKRTLGVQEIPVSSAPPPGSDEAEDSSPQSDGGDNH